MSNPVFDLIGKSYANVKEEKVSVSSTNEMIVLENKEFDYKLVDNDMATYLQNKEIEIKNIFAKAYTDIGRVLTEAQERLSGNNQYDGMFYKWFTSLGFKKDKVYSLISRYKLLIGNSDKQDLIEKLPLSLSYEIAKESCSEELKKKVLAGEIKTLKEFREFKEKNEEVTVAEIIVSTDEIKEELIKVDSNYRGFLEKAREMSWDKFDNNKKMEIFSEIKSIEKRIEKLMKNIEKDEA